MRRSDLHLLLAVKVWALQQSHTAGSGVPLDTPKDTAEVEEVLQGRYGPVGQRTVHWLLHASTQALRRVML